MKKKLLLLIVILLFSALFMGSCASAPASFSPAGEAGQSAFALLDEFERIFTRLDRRIACAAPAAEAAEAHVKAPSDERRAAALDLTRAALLTLAKMEQSRQSPTSHQQKALIAAGFNPVELGAAYDMEQALHDALTDCLTLQSAYLQGNYPDLDALAFEAAYIKEYTALENKLQWICFNASMLDYEGGDIDAFCEERLRTLPSFGQYVLDWETDRDTLMREGEDIIKREEQLYLALCEELSRQEQALTIAPTTKHCVFHRSICHSAALSSVAIGAAMAPSSARQTAK